jgi:uncharacterized protein YacL (UPF0231 family)
VHFLWSEEHLGRVRTKQGRGHYILGAFIKEECKKTKVRASKVGTKAKARGAPRQRDANTKEIQI